MPPGTTTFSAGGGSLCRVLSSSHTAFPASRRPSGISFKAARFAGLLLSVGGRIAEKRSHATTEAVFKVALASIEENGTHGDSGVEPESSFSLKLIMFLCSLMMAATSASTYGSPGSTPTVIRNMRSTGMKTSGSIHNPKTAIGGTALSVWLASLSSPLPIGLPIGFLPPPCR